MLKDIIKMGEIFKVIFGNYTWLQLFGYLWFFLIGYCIYFLTEVINRDVQNISTPKKWNWKFWFQDNWRRYLITILCTYVLFRFSNEINGRLFSYFDAVTLGLIGDGIAVAVKKRINIISGNREKLMESYNDGEKG
jgi:hypothetical protein